MLQKGNTLNSKANTLSNFRERRMFFTNSQQLRNLDKFAKIYSRERFLVAQSAKKFLAKIIFLKRVFLTNLKSPMPPSNAFERSSKN